jgi:hypothetical protein
MVCIAPRTISEKFATTGMVKPIAARSQFAIVYVWPPILI